MVNHKEILRLKNLGLTHREIAEAAKIGFKAPSARCLSTTAPEFEHHFHATKHQGLIIVLAQSNCDESNWRFCNDKLSRNFAVKQSPVQSANH